MDKTNYDRSKMFSHQVNYQINCFALNSAGNRVMIAGKNEWELFTIGENQFISNDILIKKNIFKIMDICWSKDESLVVSCGSNGELQKLIIAESKIYLDHNFNRNKIKLHDKTINKIHFDPHDPNILISGGQDGIINLTDFRCMDPESKKLSFVHDFDDKVTDIQFNPLTQYQFASGSENGSVFIWDSRFPAKYEKKFSAHLGGIHLDWHPVEKNWLATASRDKQIFVWDLSNKNYNSAIYNLTHSESVSSIKWRPKRRMQITSCSVTTGSFHLYVWDLMRPYVPYASFDSATNKVQNFMWLNSKEIIASTIQNFKYYINFFNISEAVRPADHATLVAIEMEKSGSVAFAVGVEDPERSDIIPEEMLDDLSQSSDSLNNNTEKFKITKSILYYEDKIDSVKLDWFVYSAENYKFKGDSFEEICDHNANVALKFNKYNVYKDWMIFKTMYKTDEKHALKASQNHQINPLITPNEKLVDANSEKDKYLNDFNSVIHGSMNPTESNINSSNNSSDADLSSKDTSSNVSLLSGSNSNINLINDDIKSLKLASKKVAKQNDNNSINNMITSSNNNLVNDSHLETQYDHQYENFYSNEFNSNLDQNEEDFIWPNNLIQNNKVYNQEDDNSFIPNDIIEYKIDISDNFLNEKDPFSNQKNDINRLSNKYSNNFDSNSLFELNNFNRKLSKKQFNIEDSFDFLTRSNNEKSNELLNPINVNKITSNEDILLNNINLNPLNFKFSSKNISNKNHLIENIASELTNSLAQSSYTDSLRINEILKVNFDKYFEKLLLDYVNINNDLSTTIFMYLVSVCFNKFDKSKIDGLYLDEWFSQYIELLSKFELWNLRTEIIKACDCDYIKSLTQKSISYNVMCSNCKITIKQNNFTCKKCGKNVFICVYCHLPVKRLFSWCHHCGHGGHLDHIIQWFKKYTKCPSGCGCSCSH